MLSRIRSGRASQIDGGERVWIRIEPNRGQMARLGRGPDAVQGKAFIERHPECLLDGVKNPEPANLVDEDQWIYKGVLSERSYQVDEDQPEGF